MESDSKMSSGGVLDSTEEPKGELHQGKHVDVVHSEVLANRDLMSDAVDGENREHEMGVWTAVKKYPWAALWAFIMCFTIVSLAIIPPHAGSHPQLRSESRMCGEGPEGELMQVLVRSWSRLTCSSTVTLLRFPRSKKNTVSTSRDLAGPSQPGGRAPSSNPVNAAPLSVSSWPGPSPTVSATAGLPSGPWFS